MSSKMSNAPDQSPYPLTDQSMTDQSMEPYTTQTMLLRAVIESLMDGVLVVSTKGEIVQCNNRGRQICKRLRRQSDCNLELGLSSTQESSIPYRETLEREGEPQKTVMDKVETLSEWKILPSIIWTVCQTLLDSQKDFPGLLLVPEQQLILPSTATEDDLRLRIRAQWLTLPPESVHQTNHLSSSDSQAYILVTLEDKDQSIQHLATTDKKRYRLTPRETEIWQMRLRGQSYRDIAAHLVISQNTVKKHLKNIFAKRRDVLEDAG